MAIQQQARYVSHVCGISQIRVHEAYCYRATRPARPSYGDELPAASIGSSQRCQYCQNVFAVRLRRIDGEGKTHPRTA
ncbi:hypothetical protein J2789_004769 [Variovorax paradoxus]|nr:hypothetical protein [Variovorax paradoxus]